MPEGQGLMPRAEAEPEMDLDEQLPPRSEEG